LDQLNDHWPQLQHLLQLLLPCLPCDLHTNITALILFVGRYGEDEPLDLKTNPLQEGKDDDSGLTIGPIKGSVTRSMLRKIQEGMNLQGANGFHGLQMLFS